MAILKIKDENGNLTEIPAIKGKSAYSYAPKIEWLLTRMVSI